MWSHRLCPLSCRKIIIYPSQLHVHESDKINFPWGVLDVNKYNWLPSDGVAIDPADTWHTHVIEHLTDISVCSFNLIVFAFIRIY